MPSRQCRTERFPIPSHQPCGRDSHHPTPPSHHFPPTNPTTSTNPPHSTPHNSTDRRNRAAGPPKQETISWPQKQIAANRQNALKSTGPRTPEGKAASSHNALSHGLLSEDVVLHDEERSAYEAFAASLQSDLQPAGALEDSAVQQIAWLHWRIQRIARIETGMLDFEIEHRRWQESHGVTSGGPKDQTPRASLSRLMGIAYCQLDQSLGRLSRYESHLRRSLRQALADLESLQQRRQGKEKEKEKTNPIPPQPVAAKRRPIPFPAPNDEPECPFDLDLTYAEPGDLDSAA